MEIVAENFLRAREFQQLFPTAVHKIVAAERDFGTSDGWTPVKEWTSRAHLYNRYVIVLRVAIDIAEDGTISELESPKLEIIQVERVERGKDDQDGPKYELIWYRFEEGAWEELTRHAGDFSSLEFEFDKHSPVDRFDVYWQDTQ
jgi:hypothetical protein